MNETDLLELEKIYNFNYPKIYHDLAKDSMLSWGKLDSDWQTNVLPELMLNPPLLLYYWDFEIVSNSKEVIDIVELLSDGDYYLDVKPELHKKFIPFGTTGGGDYFCFYLDSKNNVKHIVLLLHDDFYAEILADNFQDFLFRYLLESVQELDEDMLIMNNNVQENIQNYLNSHKKYLTIEQSKIVTSVFNRDNLLDFNSSELINILENYGLSLDKKIMYANS